MNKGWKYVCDVNTTPEIQGAFKALESWWVERKQREEFLKKQFDDLNATHTAKWKALFDAAKAAGKLDAKADYEKTGMQISHDNTQIFAGPTDDGGPPEFIKKLLGL